MIPGLIKMFGAVALLLWGTYMVKTGILRTFGDTLRDYLSQRLKSRVSGFFSGVGLAMALQSSTASALLIAGLQGKGLVTTLVALAAVLGADLGSALAARILSFDLSLLGPFFTLIGTGLFLWRPDQRLGQFGRILLGLAFILGAISAIGAATAPLRGPEAARVLELIAGNALLCAAAGALLAVLSFSSLAAVMITAGAAAAGAIPPDAALWCVLGANFGSAALALATTWKSSVVVRRAPVGNCIFRSAAFLLGACALFFFPEISGFSPDGADGPIYFHLAFNAAAGIVGLLFLGPAAAFVDRLLPDKRVWSSSAVRILGAEDMISPETVLKELRAETVKSAGFLSEAWEQAKTPLAQNLPSGVMLEMRERFANIRRRGKAIDSYLDRLVRRELPARDSGEWRAIDEANDVMALISRVADKMLEYLDEHKCEKGRIFSPEGLAELEHMHRATGDQLERFKAFLAAKPDAALEIGRSISEAQAKDAEENFALIAKHMERVASGRAYSVETSALHVEMLAVYRRIDGMLAASAGLSGDAMVLNR